MNDNALWSTQFKLAGGAEPAGTAGSRLGANFQSRPGSERSINYAVVRSILPTLTQTSVNVRLNEPGSAYNDRVNQLDLANLEGDQRRPPAGAAGGGGLQRRTRIRS